MSIKNVDIDFYTFAVEVLPSRIDWLIVGGLDIFGSRLNLLFAGFSDVPVPARERLVERFEGCFVIFGFLDMIIWGLVMVNLPSTRMRSDLLRINVM